MYDVLIVGGGPAGCSAALTLRMRGKSVLMAYAGGGALEKAARVDNYPGLPRVSGKEMLSLMHQQVKDAGAETRENLVQRILPMGKYYTAMIGNEIADARGVIIATGIPRVALIEGEEKLVGMGVSYCATCDGMFYKEKRVAVIGAWEEGAEEANFLAGIAAELDYYVESAHDVSALTEKIRCIREKPLSMERTEEGIMLKTGARAETYDGVFVLRPAMAMSQLMPEMETENQKIKIHDGYQTSLKHVLIAGDLQGAPYQIAKAVGDGNAAALMLNKMLDDDQKNNG
ncbi:MAG: NAD(P)/FAD-dependent oxidoreductase [Clostridiales bacterium]|nr:NAD(P)/FAD-dependent oxidoreductase [Clostridiales bacterium]